MALLPPSNKKHSKIKYQTALDDNSLQPLQEFIAELIDDGIHKIMAECNKRSRLQDYRFDAAKVANHRHETRAQVNKTAETVMEAQYIEVKISH